MLTAFREALNERLLLYLCECFQAEFIIWFTSCKSFYFLLVGSGKLLLILASTVILGSESSGTHRILPCHDSGNHATRSYFPWVVWLLSHEVRRIYNIQWVMKWIEETGFSLLSLFHKKRDTQWVLCYYRHNKFPEELMLFTFLETFTFMPVV
jgi:hypothetical protein